MFSFTHHFSCCYTFLTVSEQLNIEAYCLALTKFYTFGPTFRAENSNTSRHLAEFWMIEPKIAFADLADNASLAEGLLKYTFETDRKSTRLNSSHRCISYAVFCLKKKKRHYKYKG